MSGGKIRQLIREIEIGRRMKRYFRYEDALYELDPGFYSHKPSYIYKKILNGEYDELVREAEELRRMIDELDP